MIDQSAPALLVIDMQESFRQRESWSEISDPDIASKVTELVDHARKSQERVVWVLHEEPGTGNVFDPALGFCRPMPGLTPAAGEPVLRKTSHNAFTTTGLAQLLTASGVQAVRVCGIRTEQCCETTARVASDLGYAVEFVLDATATHPLPLWNDDSPILSTAEVQQRTAAALTGRFAVITTVAEVVGR